MGWAPHIKLIYPFLRAKEFRLSSVSRRLTAAGCEPFELCFDDLGLAHHHDARGTYATVFLKPDTRGVTQLRALANGIAAALPAAPDGAWLPNEKRKREEAADGTEDNIDGERKRRRLNKGHSKGGTRLRGTCSESEASDGEHGDGRDAAEPDIGQLPRLAMTVARGSRIASPSCETTERDALSSHAMRLRCRRGKKRVPEEALPSDELKHARRAVLLQPGPIRFRVEKLSFCEGASDKEPFKEVASVSLQALKLDDVGAKLLSPGGEMP